MARHENNISQQICRADFAGAVLNFMSKLNHHETLGCSHCFALRAGAGVADHSCHLDYGQFHAKDFEVVGISFDSSRDSGKQKLKRFVEKEKMPWPQYFDGKVWENKFGIQYGIRAIPAMWLVDKNGNLRETNARDDLEGKVKKLLRG